MRAITKEDTVPPPGCAGAECLVEAAPSKARLTRIAVVPSADPLLRVTELQQDESILYSEFSQSQWT